MDWNHSVATFKMSAVRGFVVVAVVIVAVVAVIVFFTYNRLFN